MEMKKVFMTSPFLTIIFKVSDVLSSIIKEENGGNFIGYLFVNHKSR